MGDREKRWRRGLRLWDRQTGREEAVRRRDAGQRWGGGEMAALYSIQDEGLPHPPC